MEVDQVADIKSELIEPDSVVTCCRFRKPVQASNDLLATSHLDGSVKLHKKDAEKFTVALELKDHFFPVNDIAFTERAPWLASCANDTIVNLFDINDGKLCRSFIGGHTSFVTRVIFNK
jgi:WD40 repeat protein